MSTTALFFSLASIEVVGFFIIWFRIKSKVRRYLELENLLEGVREEARALVLELNETADRNVSLVEDRMLSLRKLLDEADRRMGVVHREFEKRDMEREVYTKLNRRRPIVPGAARLIVPEVTRSASDVSRDESSSPAAPNGVPESPITLNLGSTDEEKGQVIPEVKISADFIVPSMTKREEALDLYRRGISAELIAAKLGVTVAEIELLIEIEERRRAGAGGVS
jgi:hypothetical protein